MLSSTGPALGFSMVLTHKSQALELMKIGVELFPHIINADVYANK